MTDPLTKLTKAKLLDLYVAENHGTATQHPQLVLDAMRWTKARLIHEIKRGREDRLELTYSARALAASKAANYAWFDDLISVRGYDSEYLSALAKNYNEFERQFAVPRRYWWEYIPYAFGWFWRIPYGWALAFIHFKKETA